MVRTRRELTFGIGIMTALALGGCASPVPLAPPLAEGPAGESFNQRDYVLAPSDKLRLLVFNEPNLSGDFEVSQTGIISLPLIGQVKAEGVTVAALEESIAARLRSGYLNDPRVSVEVLTYRPFFILGEVRNPNRYPYQPGLTVASAVATAQGYTYRANTNRVYIKRAGSDQEYAYPAEGTVIFPGDIVRVPERFF